LLPAACLVLSLTKVGERTRRTTERVAWLLVAVVGVVGLGWTLYLILAEGQIIRFRGVLGGGLLVMMALFLMGGPVWQAERGLLPVSFATLVLAAIGPGARVTPVMTVAALGLVAWLLIDRSSPPAKKGGNRVSWVPASVFVSLTAVLAALIIGALPVAQPFVEQVARRFSRGGGNAGLSESGSLGAVAQIGLSRKIVLRMWSDAPGLLRARVHSSFDGKTWTSPPGTTRTLQTTAVEVVDNSRAAFDDVPGTTFTTGRESVGTDQGARILVARSSRGWVVTPRNPLTIRVGGGTPTIDAAGVLSAPFRPAPSLYALTYGTAPPKRLDPKLRQAALQLPEEIDARLVDLAARLSARSDGDAGRVDATVAWVGDCCVYSLEVGVFETDQPVAEFLFDKQRGYCEYFAAAAAILLRLQGIPTRYVTGLSVQAANRSGDHYLVRALDAHAWIEVWLDGVGWVEVDPTPPAQYAALRAGLRDGWMRRSWEHISSFTAEVVARVGTDWRAGLGWLSRTVLGGLADFVARWKIVLGGVFLIVAGLAALGRVRRLRTGTAVASAPPPDPGVGPELVALMVRLEGLWAELGHARPRHRALLEHIDGLPIEALPEGLLETSRAAVTCYYEVRLGGRSLGQQEVAELHLALES